MIDFSKQKILIANRGEIACRIIATAKKLGIPTVAIYSDTDANALYVQQADEAVHIGSSLAKKSYLDIKKVVGAAKKTGATMVHPGYGFLSENAKFAKALEREGITFVGPNSYAIEAMGDKIKSKKIAADAGVNSVPGHLGVIKDAEEAKKIAKKIGYPVMIKASAGGGGKGMRTVYHEEELDSAFQSATNEARNSFGDERIFMEKYIERPRHIEVQIIADKFGRVVCLGERECSIQRNNQKVIEEAPSPFISQKTREKMFHQSRLLAKKVDYCSAGTIEFIVDSKENFYFLEMNTRLQVEHPVTELTTDLDVVELMIRIALDEKLPFDSDWKAVPVHGWALECRICAEDPSRGFLPSVGRINNYKEPKLNSKVRVDTGIYEGGEISMFYDPMIAKLCTYGENRQEAIENMRIAISQYYITGISHNISFLETILHHPRFEAGDLSTWFIKEEFPDGFEGNELNPELTEPFIGTALTIHYIQQMRRLRNRNKIDSSNDFYTKRWIVILNEKSTYLCEIEEKSDGYYSISYNNNFFLVQTQWKLGYNLFSAIITGKEYNVKIEHNDQIGNFVLQCSGVTLKASVMLPKTAEYITYMHKPKSTASNKNLLAPLAGKIARFMVKEGDLVEKGQELVAIEAMKVENIIRATQRAKVAKIYREAGDLVMAKDLLIEFLQEEEAQTHTIEQRKTPLLENQTTTDQLNELKEVKPI